MPDTREIERAREKVEKTMEILEEKKKAYEEWQKVHRNLTQQWGRANRNLIVAQKVCKALEDAQAAIREARGY